MPGPMRLLLLAVGLLALMQLGSCQPKDPTPDIQTDNLPHGICRKRGNYLVPDISDGTSYYVCCGTHQTTVRRTCTYETIGWGQYDILAAAPYDSKKGRCLRTQAPMTAGSFRSPAVSVVPSWRDKMTYDLTPAVYNEEAAATCKSAAEPAPREAPGNITSMVRQANPGQSGQWQLIKNKKGGSSTGVVAINAVLLPDSDEVLMWSRLHSGVAYEPGVVASDGVPEVSTVFGTINGVYTVKSIRSTPFCSGQTILPSGQVLATGGDDLEQFKIPKNYPNGLKGIRLYNPGPGRLWSKGSWTTLKAELRSPRWYPTQALMPDGNRVVIIGGRQGQNDPKNSPSAEIYDHRQLRTVNQVPVPLFDVNGIWNGQGSATFPLLYTLPFKANNGDVQLFTFNCNLGAILTLRLDNSLTQTSTIGNWPSSGFCAAFSAGGTGTMLMLEPETGYTPEVVMFGGWEGKDPSSCKCDNPTSAWSHRIKLDKAAVDKSNFAWTREQMPYGRNLNDCVLLPNGKIVIVNGAKSGLVDNLRNAAYDAWMYDPKAPAGKRFTTLAPATVKRYYHSTALLLPDGSILTAGSELGECTAACAAKTPYSYQHQAERFLPPYFFTGGRPEITSLSAKELKYGGTVTLGYKGTVTGAVIMTPGAVTHQVNMNQRGVKLAVVRNAAGKITVRMPPNNYITQPGYHMIFLMNGDKPCKKASWVRINL